MPVGNRDSSDLTRKRASGVLYGWYTGNAAAANAGGVRREQPTTQLLSVTTQRQLGACYCANQGVYDFVGCGACGRSGN